MNIPGDLRYTKEHEWARQDGDTVVIGITDHAQEQLGDIVFVELPEPGSQITKDETFGTVESVKAVSEIYAPVDGDVTAVNPKIQASPEILNADPHGDAWLIRVRLTDRNEVEGLMSAEEYEAYIAEEKAH